MKIPTDQAISIPAPSSVPVEESLPFELEALSNAKRYQEWVYDKVKPWLGKRVLEIGAGVGNISQWLPVEEKLILTEGDPTLYGILCRNAMEWRKAGQQFIVDRFDFVHDPIDRFVAENLDTIISFNVLEHIEDDHAALARLCEILRKSSASGPKRLVCFVPAHSWAYGSLDRTFGHFRRYNHRMIQKIAAKVAPEARIRCEYFNIVGLFGWVLQGRLMKRTHFGVSSVKTFESLCPVIRPVDDFIHQYLKLPMGQSMLAVLEW